MNAHDKIVKARGQMLNVAPFWATIALMLTLKEDKTCPTAYTDGKVFGYNPDFIDRLTNEELQGVCAHEAGHVVLDHMTRRGERKPKKWNVACDYALNGLIRETFRLPKGALYDAEFNDMSAEKIYDQVEDQNEDGKGGGGSGSGEGDGSESGDGDPGGCGEVRDFKGDGTAKTDSELQSQIDQLRREVQIAVTQAGQIAKGYGNVPAGLKKLIDTFNDPKVDWKTILRRFVTDSVKGDYTWRRPNRRLVSQGIYIPSLAPEERIGGMVIAIDTSGSCYDEATLREFASELNGIAGIIKGEITIIYADTQVQRVDTFAETDRPIKLDTIGGGGTDFRPVFAHVDKMDTQPTCLIYMTDLDGAMPDYKPSYPVLWGLTGYYRANASAPFGEVVPFSERRGSW